MNLPTRAEIEAVAGQTRGMVRCTVFARKLGIHPRTVHRCFARGGLPGAREHGPRILEVPMRLLRLAEAYGLRQVELMAKTGRLGS